MIARVEQGAPVVLSPSSQLLWHLPKAAKTGRGRTLCGLVDGMQYAYGDLVRERRLCSVCRDRAPKGEVVYTAAGEFVPAPKPKRRAARRVPQFTDAQVQLLYQTYVEKQIGTPALADLVWKKLGFRSSRSCANAITRAFADRGLQLRSRTECHRRTNEGRRLLGFGGGRDGELRLDARTIDRLWQVYKAGHPSREICERFHRRFGYADASRFRNVLEYAWKTSGYKLRTNREAELLSRARATKRCIATTTGSDGCRPKPCGQRPLTGSLYCLHHDPDHQADVLRRAAELRARKPVRPKIAWAELRPYLEPLLVPRPDRFGRHLETAAGALARNTGIDPAIASRLLKGRKEFITVDYANRLLAPLSLTVDELEARELPIAA